MMADELKPCPFCGGVAELDREQAYRAMTNGRIGDRATVYCTTCSADMGFCYADAPGTPREDIINEMVDSWNRRTPDPGITALQARVKELEEGFGDLLTWFDTGPFEYGPWIIKSGEYGIDDAVNHCRTLLKGAAS